MPKAPKKLAKGADGYKRPPRQPKPQRSPEETITRAWRSVHDQLSGDVAFPANALKKVEKILTLRPDDDFAFLAKVQLLAGLDRYKEALELLKGGASGSEGSGVAQHPLQAAYCLYKLSRAEEALRVIEQAYTTEAKLGDQERRGLRVLEAQLKYRTEDYAGARMIYEELLDTVEPDSPEYADLETNLAACTAHLDFNDSIPGRLSDLADTLPPVATLEATPLNVLVASNASTRPSASRSHPRPPFSSTVMSSSAASAKAKKRARPPQQPRPPKLPPHIAALPPEKRPPPDPERWLPKGERSTWAARQAEMEKERERRRAEKRKNARQQTQGSAATDAPPSAPPSHAGGKKRGKR